MSTTTIRLPEDLKQRVRQAAERAGTTPHGFILQAIVEKTEREALRQDFDEAAAQRYAAIVASGETIPWTEMRRYLEQSLEGPRPARPAARKLAR
jgi:predicted transcriptional regulator